MKTFRRLFGSLLLLASSVAFAQPTQHVYDIDVKHSEVTFKVKHLGISNVAGRFTQFEGSFRFHPQAVTQSAVSATIEVKSIDTAEAKRDAHLLNEDFFDAEKYPRMTFVSTSAEKGEEEGTLLVLGDLTMHGVTKPVTLEVEIGGTVIDPWGNERAGFSATAKIDRQDFGMSFGKLLETGGLVVGNEVKIGLEIEGIRKTN